jgi:hypothetical protein
MPKNIELLKQYPYFYLHKKEFYVEATNFILIGNNLETIFTYLISDIGFYVFSKFYSGPQFDGTGFRYKKEYMNNLFIPVIDPKDNKILKLQFVQENIDTKKTDTLSEEIFIRHIGLDKEEIKIIKNYKNSFLL